MSADPSVVSQRLAAVGRHAPIEISSRGIGSPHAVEAWSAAAMLALQLAVRVAYDLRLRVDTDEPQHLHVAWAWTQGLVPYRDVFDNHAPLFHVAMAPLVAALGERADLLIAMRLAMLPLIAAMLWCTRRLGRALFCDRVGIWAAVLVGVMPAFLLTSIQFRADDLWAALWLAALATALGGPFRTGRALATGVLIGMTFATSMKTSLLFTTQVAAVLMSIAMDRERTIELRARRTWSSAGACVAGMAMVAAVVIGLFAWLGALSELGDFVFIHNLAGRTRWDHRGARVAMFVVMMPAVTALGAAVLRYSSTRGFARCVVLLGSLFYIITLNGFWPIVTPQDCLPFYPVLAVFAVAAALEFMPEPTRKTAMLLASVTAAQILCALWAAPLSDNHTRFYVGFVGDVLRLTDKTAPVMDLRGEALFRLRPFFYGLEDITWERLRTAELRDDIAERLVASRTYVSVVDSEKFPPRARAFMSDNYVAVGRLRVAGQLFSLDAAGLGRFTIAIPGHYALLTPDGAAVGELDGSPLERGRTLDAGPHVFRPTSSPTIYAVLWANAAERGYSPFHPRLEDVK
jgi:hypothetical protein